DERSADRHGQHSVPDIGRWLETKDAGGHSLEVPVDHRPRLKEPADPGQRLESDFPECRRRRSRRSTWRYAWAEALRAEVIGDDVGDLVLERERGVAGRFALEP